MKVILIADVKKVGQRGTVVEVADGYAQNVLIPKRFALPATAANLKQVEKRETQVAERRAMDATLAKKALAEIDGKTLVIKVRANENGGLFEAVREKQIIDVIRDSFNVALPDDALRLGDPLKKLGTHEIRVEASGARATLYLQLAPQ